MQPNERFLELEHRAKQASTALEQIKALNEMAELALKDCREKAEEILSEAFHLFQKLPRNEAETEWQIEIAKALYTKSLCAYQQADFQNAIALAEDCVERFNRVGSSLEEAAASNHIGRIYYAQGNYPLALKHFRESLVIREKEGNPRAVSSSLNNIGLIHFSTVNYGEALKCYQESLKIKYELNDKQGIASTLNNCGLVYAALSDYANALKAYQEALTIQNQIGDMREAALVKSNIGDLYLLLGDTYRALKLYCECLLLRQEIGDKRGEASSLSALARVHEYTGDYKTSLALFEQSLEFYRKIGDQISIATTLNNIGKNYERLNQAQSAFGYYSESLNLLRESGDTNAYIGALNRLGEFFLKQNRFSEAATTLDEALNLSLKKGLKREEYAALEHLSLLYAATQDFRKAFETYQRFHQVKEAVFSNELSEKLANQQAIFETVQAQQEAELARIKNVELTAALGEAERQKKIAEEANKFKTEVLGVVSHDLKNPLQTIMGFSQLIQESDSPEQSRKSAQQIEKASKRMFSLINNLLDSVKIDTRHVQLTLKPVALGDVLLSSIESLRPQAEFKFQTIVTDEIENCIAEIDEERMREVFDNLISNAVKYSPKGKNITIRCQTQASEAETDTLEGKEHIEAIRRVLISIRDEGQGLTEEDKVGLFKKFQQLSAQPTGNEVSTGLGLAIVKQLVELHGGKVWAESAGRDQGSTFFILLPLKPKG